MSSAIRTVGVLQKQSLTSGYIAVSKCIRTASNPSLRVPRRFFHSSGRRENSIEDTKDCDFLEKFKKTLCFPHSTESINIQHLSKAIGESVILHGYLGNRHDLSKNLSFVSLLNKELDYSVQIVCSTKNDAARDALKKVKALRPNSAVVVEGVVKKREPTGKESSKVNGIPKVTDAEVELSDIVLLNEFPSDIIVTPDTVFPPEKRFLQLRTSKQLRDGLVFRANVASACRSFLQSQDFLEVETPVLFKSTPEGAREFIVPTRREGYAYALPQSPQQYKQILMASGIPKYYQFAKCFRDEDLRADRQPEFTQLDLELSFATADTVMNTTESLLKTIWKTMLPKEKLPDRFPIISYQDAMSKYGSDKPDLRLGMEIHRIEHMIPVDLISKISPLTDPIVEVLKLRISKEPKTSRVFATEFMDSPEASDFITNPDGQPGISFYDSSQPLSGLQPFGFEAAAQLEDMLGLEDGDLVVIQARKRAPHSGGSTTLGKLRLALHRAAVSSGHIRPPTGFKFTWVRDFPLFTPTTSEDPGQGGEAGLSSTHHPFTSPKTAEDVDKLMTAPSEVVGDHYDIVLNGVELGGGSRRIHSAQVQEFILRNVLKISEQRLSDFQHLIDALRAGCPPHAGIALGFDRLVAVMLGRESVRDVIAFPKSGRGEDLMVKSPSPIKPGQLEAYHLSLKTNL